MQKEKFQEYLHNPQNYKSAEISDLKELVSEYPWFSSAAIILLNCCRIQEDADFDMLLKKHSIFIPDRKILHKLLRPGTVIQEPIFEPEEIEVTVKGLHSRIQGIFENEESIVTPGHIQQETVISSVLDDNTLLDFSYTKGKREKTESEPGNAVEGRDLNESSESNVSPTDSENKSFDHWISRMSTEPSPEESPLKKYEIIESFIHSDPGVIRADKETNLLGDVSKGSAEENEGFITDTLAKIYVKQGLYNKAIYAYEKLCLKYPEKSIYFVTQIEEIKRLYIKK